MWSMVWQRTNSYFLMREDGVLVDVCIVSGGHLTLALAGRCCQLFSSKYQLTNFHWVPWLEMLSMFTCKITSASCWGRTRAWEQVSVHPVSFLSVQLPRLCCALNSSSGVENYHTLTASSISSHHCWFIISSSWRSIRKDLRTRSVLQDVP